MPVQPFDPFDPQTFSAGNARAAVVNRTRRVVRARAQAMRARRKRARDLVLPLLICSIVLVLFCYAGWSVSGNMLVLGLEGEGATGYVLLLWFLPVTAFAVGSMLFRRWCGRSHDEVAR